MSKSVFVLASVVQAHSWFVYTLPRPHESCQAQHYHNEIGGKGLNVTIAFNRLGIKVYPLIGCGQDYTADKCQALLAQEGISTRFLYRFDNYPSGNGVALIDDNGNNSIVVALAANLAINAKHVEQLWSDENTQIGLCYAQFETAQTTIERAFILAHTSDKYTVLNPSPWQIPSSTIRQNTQIMIVNEIEATELLALKHMLDPAVAHEQLFQVIKSDVCHVFAQWSALNVLIITLGQYGAIALQREDCTLKQWSMKGLMVQTIDPTGCGDAFSAVFCAACLNGDTIDYALAKANCAGAWMAAHTGILDNLLNFTEIDNVFNQHKQILAKKIGEIQL